MAGDLIPTGVEAQWAAGYWCPIYYGNRFKVARDLGPRREQEESLATFATLDEACAEANRLNDPRPDEED